MADRIRSDAYGFLMKYCSKARVLRPSITRIRMLLCSCSAKLQELRELLIAQDPDAHYAVHASFILMADSYLQLAEALIRCPGPTLDLLDDALFQAQAAIRCVPVPNMGGEVRFPKMGGSRGKQVFCYNYPTCTSARQGT